MKRLFLTSSVGTKKVAESIYHKLGSGKKLKTAFITTPVETEDEQKDLSWLEEDRLALNQAGFATFDYTITGKTLNQIKTDLADIEVLYISGGNTNYLLEQSQKSNFIKYVQDYVNNGGIYLSTSAGSIIAGQTLPPYLWGDENGAPNLVDYTCYSLVKFTVIPHWRSQHFADKYLKSRMEQIYDPNGVAYVLLTDNQYIEVTGDTYKIVDVSKGK